MGTPKAANRRRTPSASPVVTPDRMTARFAREPGGRHHPVQDGCLDVGHDELRTLVDQVLGPALQHEHPVGETVAGDVAGGRPHGGRVQLHGRDPGAQATGRRERQDAGPRAEVQRGAKVPLGSRPVDRQQAIPRGGVVAGPEDDPGIDHQGQRVGRGAGGGGVPGGDDAERPDAFVRGNGALPLLVGHAGAIGQPQVRVGPQQACDRLVRARGEKEAGGVALRPVSQEARIRDGCARIQPPVQLVDVQLRVRAAHRGPTAWGRPSARSRPGAGPCTTASGRSTCSPSPAGASSRAPRSG